MKKILLWVSILWIPSSAFAGYFHSMDVHHIQQSASYLYDPHGIAPQAMTTDIAVITHSTQDGTIIPEKLQPYIPPESWSPLELGFGGTMKADFLLHAGTSVNLAPQISSLIMAKVSSSSPVPLQVVKNALNQQGAVRARIGYGEVGDWVRGGNFQSAKEMLPGRGILDILNRAGRIEAGLAWTF